MSDTIKDKFSCETPTYKQSEYRGWSLPLLGPWLFKESEKQYNDCFAQFREHVTEALQLWSHKNQLQKLKLWSLGSNIVKNLWSALNGKPFPKSAEDYLKLAGGNLQEMITIVEGDYKTLRSFVEKYGTKTEMKSNDEWETKTTLFERDFDATANHLRWLKNYRDKFPVFQCAEDKQ